MIRIETLATKYMTILLKKSFFLDRKEKREKNFTEKVLLRDITVDKISSEV